MGRAALRALLIAGLFAGVSVGAATAQQADRPPISPDRPTASTSPGTVPYHAFQMESGWTFTRVDNDLLRTDSHGYPELLMRFGFTDRFEARATISGLVLGEDARLGDERIETDGYTDMVFGFKANLVAGSGARPQIGLLVDVSVPTGDPGFTTGYASPFVSVLFESSITDRLLLTYNLGPRFITFDDSDSVRRTFVNLDYVVTLGAAATPRIGVFAEVFGAVPLNEDRRSLHSAQAGVSLLLVNNVMIDARAGAGLSDKAADWLVGAGLSVRLPR